MRGRPIQALLAAIALTAPALADRSAKEAEAPTAELIHSDLPLYDFSYKDVWPRHFTEDDGSFGCSSRISFGNWTFTDSKGDTETWQIANYGVFHCAAIFRQARSKSELDQSEFRHGLIVLLGTAIQEGEQVELWALQKGMVPGSDYVLMARKPDDQIIKSFSVLQRACSKSDMRRLPAGQTLDIWKTRYCAINQRADLLSLAKQMLARSPLGKLEWTEASDP